MNNKKLFLLDAMALIYRAYFAFSKNMRINSKGMNTSAILGFTNTLFELLNKEQPTHIGVVFDTLAPTARHENFANYKANRQDTPEDIINSIPYIQQIIEGFNIPVVYLDGYEADDVIGTIATQASLQGFTTYMMTPDKDFGQLVNENTFIYKPARMGNAFEIMGIKEVCEKFEVQHPKQVIDILALWGDQVDNIPGVPGVGEKIAKKLIATYGSVENVIAHAEELTGKIKENIIKFSEQAMLSKALATIIVDAPFEFQPEAFEVKPPSKEKLLPIFEELEFRTLPRRIFKDLDVADKAMAAKKTEPLQFDLFNQPEDIQPSTNSDTQPVFASINTQKVNYQLVTTLEDIEALIKQLEKVKYFAFDTETTSLDATLAELVSLAFSFEPHKAYVVYFDNKFENTKTLLHFFQPIFSDTNILKIGQNVKYDLMVLQKYGLEIAQPLFDTMLAHYLISPEGKHSLDVLAQNYLNYKTISIESLIGKKGTQQGNMRFVDVNLLKDYAAEDVDITIQLYHQFQPLLIENNFENLFNKIEMPLVPVLAKMELEGVNIDVDFLHELSHKIGKEIESIESEIFNLAGLKFNIASPKQLGDVLFDVLQIASKPKKTKTGQYATSEEILTKLSGKHPIIDKILEIRELQKLKSTYVDTLPLLINPITKRIHTSYNQAVTVTGRLSSTNPNLQNIPIRTEQGQMIRKAFVPRNENYLILSADYSQIELRIIAELSQDASMIAAFIDKQDIHKATAAKIYNVSLDEVTPVMRRNAKTVNFGIIYGISAFGLSERLGIPRKEAAEIIEQYFQKYPTIKMYMDKSIATAKEKGYVETIMGRRRYLPDIYSSNAVVRGYAERNAINMPIQGSAADIIKLAMINIHQSFEQQQLKSKMIMQVHDELVFDVHLQEVDIVKQIVQEKMTSAVKTTVPLDVDINVGQNWLEAH